VSERADGVSDGSLLEVAVVLPLPGTFTYRDPRTGPPAALGTQVVVPFGRRTVTGFVVGHPAYVAAGTTAAVRDIEDVVGAEPALDADMIGLCRWAADYYFAPLGEVLRAALPQGERASAARMVRLTPDGERAAAAPPDLDGTRGADAALLAALREAGGSMRLRSLMRARRGAARLLARLAARGLVERGDAVADRKAAAAVRVAVAVPGADVTVLARGRAPARRRVYQRIAAGPAGVPAADLPPRDRVHLRSLAAIGLIRLEARPRPRAPSEDAADPTDAGVTAPPLTSAQAEALDALIAALSPGCHATFLLAGVTGSGKTEVYLRLIAHARAAGRGALVLVPEIALTPQLAARFRARFGPDVAVLHSALPPAERLAAWRRLRSGEVRIAVGARSAVFAPVQALGVVVVDEEHDGSFKQEDGFRYHARDLAVVRAQRAGAVAVLGSATPSLESHHNAEIGRFRRLRLPHRATPRPLPDVDVIDLRRHPPGPDGLLSPALADAVAATGAAGEQTILFLNRRGFSTVVLCHACGHGVRCGNCAVSMTYHRGRDRLVCHYCARIATMPDRCAACASPRLERLGMGTERVEAIVRERFPDARVARLDRDTADAAAAAGRRGGGWQAVLAAMQAGTIDILVGTQMIAKGHDFAGVTLVGVLQPDQGMHLPDFRAAERTYQLLAQVAGRAGRGQRPGRVIIQTYSPDHPAVACARTHDYDGFARGELAHRKDAGYPPFARMIALRIDGTDEAQVRAVAAAAADRARSRARASGGSEPSVRVLGPAEAPIARVRGRVRWQVWLSGAHRKSLAAAAAAAADIKLAGDVRLAVDVDPQSVL